MRYTHEKNDLKLIVDEVGSQSYEKDCCWEILSLFLDNCLIQNLVYSRGNRTRKEIRAHSYQKRSKDTKVAKNISISNIISRISSRGNISRRRSTSKKRQSNTYFAFFKHLISILKKFPKFCHLIIDMIMLNLRNWKTITTSFCDIRLAGHLWGPKYCKNSAIPVYIIT